MKDVWVRSHRLPDIHRRQTVSYSYPDFPSGLNQGAVTRLVKIPSPDSRFFFWMYTDVNWGNRTQIVTG